MFQPTRKSMEKHRTILRSSIMACAIFGMFAGPAFAETNAEIMKELRALRTRLEKVENRLVSTENELVETQNELIDAQTAATQQNNIKFSKTTGTPKFVSSDGKSSFKMGGRAFLDVAALPDQYKKGEVDDLTKNRTESEVRKVYLEAEGEFGGVWEYEVSFDFAEQSVDLKDASITYGGFKGNDITVGFQKPAFGLENTQSSKYPQFMSRGLTDTFSPDRDLGIAWRNVQDWGAMKFGVFIPNSVEESADGNHRAEAYTYTGRVSVAPINDSAMVLHLGVSGAYSDYRDMEAIDFDARPESHLSQKIVGTEDIENPDHTLRYGAEAAFSVMSFLFEAEYVVADTKGEYDGNAESDNYVYDSWYLSASYMITGESHPYKRKKGTFSSVKPDNPVSKGGLGAWEVGVRYSTIDLNDNGENGGEMDDITVGLTWYLENNLKMMVNYIYYDADNYVDSADYTDQDESIVQTRLQFFF